MKRSILLASSLVLLTFVACSSQTLSTVVAPSVDTISADQLKALVDSGKDFVFVDVREDNELAEKGTLPNAVHIPLGQVEARMSEIPRDKPIVTACEMGVRAARAAAMLKKAGYKDVRSFGFREYRAKGYPLVKPPLETNGKK